MPTELPAPTWVNDFYAAEAEAHAPIPPDVITVNRYLENLRALGKAVRYNAAAKRLQAKADNGEIESVGLIYDASSGRKVRAWKIVNAKAQPDKKKSVRKTHSRPR